MMHIACNLCNMCNEPLLLKYNQNMSVNLMFHLEFYYIHDVMFRELNVRNCSYYSSNEGDCFAASISSCVYILFSP
jgi:hypothetical protein